MSCPDGFLPRRGQFKTAAIYMSWLYARRKHEKPRERFHFQIRFLLGSHRVIIWPPIFCGERGSKVTDIWPELFKDGAASLISQEKEISARPVYSHINHEQLEALRSVIFTHWHPARILRNTFQHCCRPEVWISSKSRKMFWMNSSDFSNHFTVSAKNGWRGRRGWFQGRCEDAMARAGNEARAAHLFIFPFTAWASPGIYCCLFPFATNNNKPCQKCKMCRWRPWWNSFPSLFVLGNLTFPLSVQNNCDFCTSLFLCFCSETQGFVDFAWLFAFHVAHTNEKQSC